MRERLIELIQDSVDGCARHWAEIIADHLLANGVIVVNTNVARPKRGRGLFVKVKYEDCRYTQNGGNDMWLNLDNIVAIDEDAHMVYTTNGTVFPISKDTMPKLIEAMKGCAE